MSNGDSDEKAQKEMLSNIHSPQMNPPQQSPWKLANRQANIKYEHRG